MQNLMQIENVDKFWQQPIGWYIDEKLKISIFYPESSSLYQLLHSDQESEHHINQILKNEPLSTFIRIKYEIAFQLSRILLTIHNLSSVKHHGHITSHNVFVNLKKIGSGTFSVNVKVADLELQDFMEYSNMFFSYRLASVWSAPESLKMLKKMPEFTQALDTYSFGMILWELWHIAVPFDNDINLACQYVLQEEARPKIIQSEKDQESDSDGEAEEKEFKPKLTVR